MSRQRAGLRSVTAGRCAMPPAVTALLALLLARASAAPRATAQGAPPSLAQAVNEAIERGVLRLRTLQTPDGAFRHQGINYGHHAQYPMGYPALAIYALLKAGVAPDDPAIVLTLDHLRELPFFKTYSVSTLILALDATGDDGHDAWVQDAARWLEENADPRTGLWSYPDARPAELSNAVYAALALDRAADHGYEARIELWEDLVEGLLDRQNDDGGFGYHSTLLSASYGSMTSSGVATLALARRRLEAGGANKGVLRRIDDSIEAAWDWLAVRFTPTGNAYRTDGELRDEYPLRRVAHDFTHAYSLYAMERAAGLLGHRKVAGRDWYAEGAVELLRHEEVGGGFGSIESTCFALLFLRRATLTGGSGAPARAPGRATTQRESWAYTTNDPAAGWIAPGFDDTGWSRGTPGFGSFDARGLVVRTEWTTPDLWVRRALPGVADRTAFRLWAVHDDDVEVWINGVPAASGVSWSGGRWVELEISSEARAALRPDGNQLAAHVRDMGGGRSLDLSLVPPAGEGPKPWWKATPTDAVPWMRRWLVLGPLADKGHTGFLASSIDDEAGLSPAAGERQAGGTWVEVLSLPGLVDLGAATRARDESVWYAFTHLHVARDTDAVLWIGSHDGLRIWLDGELIASHHAHRVAVPDDRPVPLQLAAGAHRLLVKVEALAGGASLVARMTQRDGTPLAGVTASLDATDARARGEVAAGDDAVSEEIAARALAQPATRSLMQLAEELPLPDRGRLLFDRASDRDTFAAHSALPDHPRWIDKVRGDDPAPTPHPGAKGIVALAARGTAQPGRLMARLTFPTRARTVTARVSPVADPERPAAGARVRLGVLQDGEPVWLAQADLRAGAKRTNRAWVELEGDASAWAGGDALVVIECLPLPTGLAGAPAAHVFVDEVAVR